MMTNGIKMDFRNKAIFFNEYLLSDNFDLLDLVIDSFEFDSTMYKNLTIDLKNLSQHQQMILLQKTSLISSFLFFS